MTKTVFDEEQISLQLKDLRDFVFCENFMKTQGCQLKSTNLYENHALVEPFQILSHSFACFRCDFQTSDPIEIEAHLNSGYNFVEKFTLTCDNCPKNTFKTVDYDKARRHYVSNRHSFWTVSISNTSQASTPTSKLTNAIFCCDWCQAELCSFDNFVQHVRKEHSEAVTQFKIKLKTQCMYCKRLLFCPNTVKRHKGRCLVYKRLKNEKLLEEQSKTSIDKIENTSKLCSKMSERVDHQIQAVEETRLFEKEDAEIRIDEEEAKTLQQPIVKCSIETSSSDISCTLCEFKARTTKGINLHFRALHKTKNLNCSKRLKDDFQKQNSSIDKIEQSKITENVDDQGQEEKDKRPSTNVGIDIKTNTEDVDTHQGPLVLDSIPSSSSDISCTLCEFKARTTKGINLHFRASHKNQMVNCSTCPDFWTFDFPKYLKHCQTQKHKEKVLTPGLRKDNIQNETKGEEEVKYENASIENEVPKTISLPTNNKNSDSEDIAKGETVKETSAPKKKKRKREIVPDSQEAASLPPKRSRTKSTRLKDFVDFEQQFTRKKPEMNKIDSPKSEELESTKENPQDEEKQEENSEESHSVEKPISQNFLNCSSCLFLCKTRASLDSHIKVTHGPGVTESIPNENCTERLPSPKPPRNEKEPITLTQDLETLEMMDELIDDFSCQESNLEKQPGSKPSTTENTKSAPNRSKKATKTKDISAEKSKKVELEKPTLDKDDVKIPIIPDVGTNASEQVLQPEPVDGKTSFKVIPPDSKTMQTNQEVSKTNEKDDFNQDDVDKENKTDEKSVALDEAEDDLAVEEDMELLDFSIDATFSEDVVEASIEEETPRIDAIGSPAKSEYEDHKPSHDQLSDVKEEKDSVPLQNVSNQNTKNSPLKQLKCLDCDLVSYHKDVIRVHTLQCHPKPSNFIKSDDTNQLKGEIETVETYYCTFCPYKTKKMMQLLNHNDTKH